METRPSSGAAIFTPTKRGSLLAISQPSRIAAKTTCGGCERMAVYR